MKTPSLPRKGLLPLVGASVMALAGSGVSATFSFAPFEFNGFLNGNTNDPLLNPIAITLMIEEDGGILFLTVLNSSDQNDVSVDGTKPTVTAIFIEDPNDILGGGWAGSFHSGVGTVAGEGVSYEDSVAGGSLPGGANIGFVSHFNFDPTSQGGKSKNGIDPGESGRFSVGTASSATVMNAFVNSQIRVGVHVQEIGDGQSASFVNTIPEPNAILIWIVGGGLLLLRRKR